MAFIGSAIMLSLELPSNGQDGPVVAPPPSHDVSLKLDSGFVENNSDQLRTAWSKTIATRNAKWTQLQFSDVVLTKGRKLSSKLKITSVEDGAFQILDAETCAQWQNKSAFFNGNAVTVELLIHPNAKQNRVVIDMVTAGDAPDLSPTESICDLVDDRQLSNDSRTGRIDIGCTAWLFDDRENCMITAGHCAPSMSAVFFNVPVSDPDGSINFPPPEDQYAIDPASIQFQNGGVGNDWCYFGCFNNSNTGLSPFAAQGDSFELAVPNSNTFDDGDPIRVTGFGVTSFPVNPILNLAQKTHVGPFTQFTGTTLRYRPDTTGGNSGSPVICDSSGMAYGVHTHAGCFNGGGANQGTGANHSSWISAINNPLGICATSAAVPSNDNCQNAIAIGDGSRNFNTSEATNSGPALPTECEEGFGLSLVNDIWYEYTATCTGVASFDFCTSNYDTRVAAYTADSGCPGSLVACNDDACELQSRMEFGVVAGEDYLIRVGGFSSGGLGTMVATCLPDNCSVAIEVINNELIIDGTQGPDDIVVTQNRGILEIAANEDCFGTVALAGIDRIVINGFGGADTIEVNALVSTLIRGGSGADDIFGSPYPNEIFGGPGADIIFGGAMDDTLNAGRGQDTVFGFAGNDTILGGDAADMISGGSGDDELVGGLGGDTLLGQGGNDILIGNAGADTLNGGAGNDELTGLGGPDQMLGGPGNDDFRGGAGYDTFNGGSGADTALDNGEVEISIENS